MHKMFGLIQVISSWTTPRMQIYTLKFPKNVIYFVYIAVKLISLKSFALFRDDFRM